MNTKILEFKDRINETESYTELMQLQKDIMNFCLIADMDEDELTAVIKISMLLQFNLSKCPEFDLLESKIDIKRLNDNYTSK